MLDNKKGLLALSSIAVIILWTVATIILLVAITMIINSSTSASEEIMCRNSVAIRAKSHFSQDFFGVNELIKKEKFTPLMCRSQNLGELKGSREEIKHQIAELASKCWWMYLEGTVPNLFDSNTEDENSCGICYYFKIPDNLDAGTISEEFVFFNELTENNLSQLKQLIKKENDDEFEENMDYLINKFEYNVIEYEGKKIIRPKHALMQQEFYNFLLVEEYDPGILYGGGNINYIGNIQKFDSMLDLRGTNKVYLREIKSLPPTHLQDLTFLINPETQEKITEFGTNLYRFSNSILLVVVADELVRHERRDARNLIESLGLNSQKDRHDALLITMDLNKGEIRIQAGALLERNIKEYEISALLERHFDKPISSVQELNTALYNLISDLEKEIIVRDQIVAEDLRFPEGTYYQYLSNYQTTAPIIESIEAGRTYAIVYKSLSDYQSFLDGEWVGALTIAAGAVLTIVGAITTIYGGAGLVGVKAGVALIVKGSAAVVISGVLVYSYFHMTGDSFADSIYTLIGTLGSGKGDNAIFIVPASVVSDICDEV